MTDKDFAMKDFWPLYGDVKREKEWPRRSFHPKKAYICCMLAELAYEHLLKHELDQWKRMKAFPCATLEARVATGPYALSAAIFAALAVEGPETVLYVVTTQYFISVIIRIEEVVFIASRGTADLYDAGVDFDSVLAPPLLGNERIRMHRGFLGEALKHADLIANQLRLDRAHDGPNIYTTGHSLGGALAAILHALYCNRGPWSAHDLGFYRHPAQWTPLVHLSDWLHIDSCYTFGMPRYGESTAIQQLPNPYSVIRTKDPVISVPFRQQGYADGLREYGTNLKAAERRKQRLYQHALRAVKNTITHAVPHREHTCELYREEIAGTLGIPFHRTLLPPEMRSERVV